MYKRFLTVIFSMFVALNAFWALLGLFPLQTQADATIFSYPSTSNFQNSMAPLTTAVEVGFASPSTFDPALAYDTASYHIIEQVYETLIAYNREQSNEFVPQIAEEWSISPDGLTYTFLIRQGVAFHDGGRLDPHDVAYSIQRGLLQSDPNSPQWLLLPPLMGYDTCHDITQGIDPYCGLVGNPDAVLNANPVALRAVCETVKTAVVADDAANTVTFNLVKPWGPFLATLVQPIGSVVDMEWSAAQGDWDGDCGTWQNYYAPGSANSILSPIMNGTGPFVLDQATPEEVVLQRNAHYWRSSPMWTNGPSGLATLENVLIKVVPNNDTRAQMLLDGEADFATVSGYEAQLDQQTLFVYDQPDGLIGTLVHPTGTLRLYDEIIEPSATDAFFVFDIATTGNYNFIGSGVFDGNGIPANFFSDIHVRKAFSYAFDWDAYNQAAYRGKGIQRTGPIVKDLIGYTDTQPTYFYSPTLAYQEMSQAWGGQALSSGIVFTLTYNTGNTTRQVAAETIKAGIEALSPNFHVHVTDMPWSEYLTAMRNSVMPIFISGWIQDIPHPHNWVAPYLTGTYADRQRMPAAMQNYFQEKSDTCFSLIGDAARVCYEDIQVSTYYSATQLFLLQSVSQKYVRAEMRGYYANTGQYGQPYYYALSKGAIPGVAPIAPETSHTISFTNQTGSETEIFLPAGSVTEPINLVTTPDVRADSQPDILKLSNITFAIDAYDEDGNPIADFDFNNPVTLVIQYSLEDIAPLIEDELLLLWWNGAAWEDAACGPYVRDLANNRLSVPICHLSTFGLAGSSHTVYLPMIVR